MSVFTYSYKLKLTANLLNEVEYAPIEAAMSDMLAHAKEHKRRTGFILLKDQYLQVEAGKKVLALSERLSGVVLDHPLAAPCLKASQYGRICPSCEKPFRTPRAKICPECGYTLPEGEVAGPLTDR